MVDASQSSFGHSVRLSGHTYDYNVLSIHVFQSLPIPFGDFISVIFTCFRSAVFINLTLSEDRVVITMSETLH